MIAKTAPQVFDKKSTFFRRVDGDAAAFKTAASQPMLVITVFGSSDKTDVAATPEVACVLPNAKPRTSGASSTASFVCGTAVILALMLHLVLQM
jgi:hypothetical protein